MSWPPSGATPINELNTEGYISCAFPTFPTGAADFVAPLPLTVTVGNYFKHLLMYADGRYMPDTLVFATLPSTQRCTGGHYRQAGSMSASTHMMPSSISLILLTWLLFISIIIVLQSQALRRKRVYRHVQLGSPL